MKPKQTNAHRLVANLALEMANMVYEELATRHNNWYAMNPDRAKFVNACAPTLVQDARQTLASMLGRNDVSEHEKQEIFEALLLDGSIPGAEQRARYTLN